MIQKLCKLYFVFLFLVVNISTTNRLLGQSDTISINIIDSIYVGHYELDVDRFSNPSCPNDLNYEEYDLKVLIKNKTTINKMVQ